MLTKYLSEDERKDGRRRIYRFQALNGMGFNFMGETPVYLLAIHFGASNIELGYISSVIFLTGFILVALPRLLAGKNLVTVQATAWFIRGLIVLLYLLLFFLEGRPAVLLILIVYTLFCAARMVGVVIWNPLVKMVTTSQNRGEVLAQGNIVNQAASVVSKLISFMITSIQFFTGVAGILLLQIIGVILNSSAAYQLKKVTCRETVEYEKGRNLFVIFKESLSSKEKRFPLMLKWLSIAVMVVNGLTIVFVRKEAGFDANFVFLYTLVIALANIMAGLFGRTFADRIGSRPLLIGVNILLSLSYIIWMLLPLSNGRSLPIFAYFILGFFSNFFLLATNVLVARVLVNSMPENESFSYNSMINFVMAFFSFFSGILGGVLIDWGQSSTMGLPNNFSFLFFFALVLSLLLIFYSLRLIDKGSLSAKETAAIFFSLEGLRAYSYIGKYKAIDDPVKKRTVIMSISQNDAPIATEELRAIISSPLSSSKGEAIKSLFSHPRVELLEDLLREASDSGSYHQLKAIFALGAYEAEASEHVLLSLLDDPDSAVRSTAAKSLGRIGHVQSIERISILADKAEQAMDKINYLIALKNMDTTGSVFEKIFTAAGSFSDGIFRQTYYSLAADLFESTPSLSAVYSSKNLSKGNGVRDFLDQTRDLLVFYNNHRNLVLWFRDRKWAQIGEFCLCSLEESTENEISLLNPFEHLEKAVKEEALRMKGLSGQEDSLIYDNALALVYFTYQILMKRKHHSS
ncbi:MFS transporter [Oceanispirochaeta sp.]|uniref:MFS transporter n=1 Tax=Oceanispirochaeta sp. TaxID=2035350 RepID=UPI002623E900|nr:MFS transporter [Oceanispirochaeta sp.]MDA3958276.1 MFS transporter [Oceanispirochaeta sp.]